jgi:hypothetical protein
VRHLSVPLMVLVACLASILACQDDQPSINGRTWVCVREPFTSWEVGKAKTCVLGGNGMYVSAALLCDDTSMHDADRAHELGDRDTHHAESVALLGDELKVGVTFNCVRQPDGEWIGIKSAAVSCRRQY